MALTCELCESTDFLKEDGMFVCQGCGTKYTVEEAKKLLSGGGSEGAAGGSARQDKIDNYLTLATNALDSSNNSEAENYASKVLELDANNARAWLIKGEAIGWQSTVANVRFTEMANCWGHCVENAAEEDLEGYRARMCEQATMLIKALINLTTNNFAELPVADNVTRVKNCFTTMLDTTVTLIGYMVFLDLTEISQYLAERANTAAVSGSDVADGNYGPDRSDKHIYAYRRWIQENDNCIELLEFALLHADKENTINTIVKNLKVLQNNAINSCCYKFEANGYTSGYYEDQSLTAAAKNIRRNQIAKYEKDAKDKIRKKKEAEEKKRREEQEKRNKEYWDAHAEEKVALEVRKAELTEQIKPLAKEHGELKVQLANIQKKANVPVAATKELEEHRKQIGALVAEKSALGIFKGKEKKALQEKIDAMEAQIPTLQEKIKQQEAEQKAAVSAEAEPVANKMQAVFAEQQKLQKELDGVEKELTMNR